MSKNPFHSLLGLWITYSKTEAFLIQTPSAFKRNLFHHAFEINRMKKGTSSYASITFIPIKQSWYLTCKAFSLWMVENMQWHNISHRLSTTNYQEIWSVRTGPCLAGLSNNCRPHNWLWVVSFLVTQISNTSAEIEIYEYYFCTMSFLSPTFQVI